MIGLADTDLPASFQEADCESAHAQRVYIGLFAGLLTCTALGALATWVSTDFESIKLVGSICAAVLTLGAFGLTTTISIRSYEKTWYSGRAIAESIKTRSWSFAMCGERYPSSIELAEAKRRLVTDIADILKEKGSLVLLSSSKEDVPQISEKMLQLRSASIRDRLETYVACRVRDQKKWYGNKAKQSSRSESISFFAMQVSQILALAVIGYSLLKQEVTSGSVGLLAAVSSSVLAWLQVRRYQETAQSYSIAHQELTSIEALSTTVVTETEFAQYVQDAENAISREHTLWVAKRIIR